MKYVLTMTFYCLCTAAMALDYTGNQLVAVLGKSVSSPEFQQYKSFWLLDSKFENPDGGIKVVINPNTLTVDTILVAGYDYAPAYSNCSSKLPYNIQLNDNVSAISQKTGVAPTHYGGNIGYDVRDYHIMVKYNSSSNINCMHFFNPDAKPYSAEPKLDVTIPEGASKRDIARINFNGSNYTAGTHTNSSTSIAAPLSTIAAQPVKAEASAAPAVNKKLESARRALENSTFNTVGTKISAPVTTASTKASVTSTPAASKTISTTPTTTTTVAPAAKPTTTNVTKTGTTTTTVVKSTPSFRTGILAVFNAWHESGFYSIKNTQRSSSNVWNYKYTYATKLRIPGEQYNMLYSFPFETSQMDFVSVLKEGDSFEGFEAAYKDFERKLMENFPKSEGWIGTCLPNYDKSNISDFEIRNDKYGSVILDYCKTPKGKHILYLRFLLYS